MKIDRKLPRAITLYIPAVLGFYLGGFSDPGHSLAWSARIGLAVLYTALAFLFVWPFVVACCHGACFLAGFFEHRPPPDKPDAA